MNVTLQVITTNVNKLGSYYQWEKSEIKRHTFKSKLTDKELQCRKWVNRSFPYVYRQPAVHDNLPDNLDVSPLLQLNTPCTCMTTVFQPIHVIMKEFIAESLLLHSIVWLLPLLHI